MLTEVYDALVGFGWLTVGIILGVLAVSVVLVLVEIVLSRVNDRRWE